MIVKASIQWLTAMSDVSLAQNTNNVVEALTNNDNFLSPSPTLAVISMALSEFRVAMAEAAKGGKEATAIKNAKRAALISLLRSLASYLTVTSGGDITKLLSSKFPPQKPTRSKIGDLDQPESPYLQQGTLSGQIYASIAPIYGVYVYNWRIALKSAPTVYVQMAQTTGGRIIFEDLTPGQVYLVQVNAVGSAGPSDWSNSSELMAV